MSGTHSILAPSGSSRWLRCVGALYLSRGIQDPDKEHSASGTCSHWLLPWQLENTALDLEASWLGKELIFGDNPAFTFKVDEERLDRVRSCVSVINREPGEMLVEHRLDTPPVLGVPDQEGHSDIIKLYPEGGAVIDEKVYKGVLSVHDYKDGYLLVNAKDNTQGLIYLCAAMLEFELIGDFNAFRFCIHQPKLHHYDEWTYTRAELESFRAPIRPLSKLAYDIYHENVRELRHRPDKRHERLQLRACVGPLVVVVQLRLVDAETERVEVADKLELQHRGAEINQALCVVLRVDEQVPVLVVVYREDPLVYLFIDDRPTLRVELDDIAVALLVRHAQDRSCI